MNERALLRVLATFAFGAAVATTPRPGHAEDPPDAGVPGRHKLEGSKLDEALADVAKARKDVRTLRAAFTQSRKIALLSTSVTSHGSLILAAPDRLRWDLAPPDDIVYFVGPEGLSYKTKSSSATAPANGAKVAAALADLRALLAGDLATLRNRYTLSASRSASDLEVTGVAKDKNASVKGFTLVLDGGLVRPLRAHLLEGKSDTIDLTFSNVVVNEPVDPAQLRP